MRTPALHLLNRSFRLSLTEDCLLRSGFVLDFLRALLGFAGSFVGRLGGTTFYIVTRRRRSLLRVVTGSLGSFLRVVTGGRRSFLRRPTAVFRGIFRGVARVLDVLRSALRKSWCRIQNPYEHGNQNWQHISMIRHSFSLSLGWLQP